MDVRIEPSWKAALAPEFDKPYFEALVRTLYSERRPERAFSRPETPFSVPST